MNINELSSFVIVRNHMVSLVNGPQRLPDDKILREFIIYIDKFLIKEAVDFISEEKGKEIILQAEKSAVSAVKELLTPKVSLKKTDNPKKGTRVSRVKPE